MIGIVNGDKKAFDILYTTYVERVYNYFYTRTQSEFHSEELTQQTFIKFWEYRYSLKAELPADVQLFYKARITYIDWLRREASHRKFNDTLALNNKAEEKAQLNTNDPDTEQLQIAINKLPEKRRQVLTMFYYENYSYKEIAEIMGISVKTVDNHLQKAMAQMRKAIKFLAFFLFQ